MKASRRVVAYLAIPVTLAASAFRLGTKTTALASAWLLVEVSLALALAAVLGIAAILAARPKTLAYLNQFVSRGIELVAALPLVLLCALIAVSTALPIPVAVGIVVGVLAGLRCIRVVATTASPGHERPPQGSNWTTMRQNVGRALRPAVPAVVEQVIGVEAALAWLGLLDRTWIGGWGERLGRAASDGAVTALVCWTLSTTALALGLKLLVWRAPAPFAEGTAGTRGT